MNVVSYLGEMLQVLGIETVGVLACAAVLYGYVKLMDKHAVR